MWVKFLSSQNSQGELVIRILTNWFITLRLQQYKTKNMHALRIKSFYIN